MNKVVTKVMMLVLAVALIIGVTSCESEYSKESNTLIQKYEIALSEQNLQESKRLSNLLESRELNSTQTAKVQSLNQSLSEWEEELAAQKRAEEERKAEEERERRRQEEMLKRQVPSWLLGEWVSDKIDIDVSTYETITSYLKVTSNGYRVNFVRSGGGGYHLDWDWELKTEGNKCYNNNGDVVFSINDSHTRLEFSGETWHR